MHETPFWRAVWAIIWKDWRLERNTGQTISVMTFFSLAAIVTFNLALQGDLAAVRNVAAGLLWVTVVLSGTLGLNRSLGAEQENRAFDAILMAPISRSALFIGKVISISGFAFVLDLILLFIFFIFTNRPFLQLPVIGILFLGTVGYVAAGVLVTSMTIQTRSRDVLLPVLLLPLTLPAVLAAASATAVLITFTDPTWNDVGFSISLVVLYDVLMVLAGLLSYHFVVEE